MKAKFKLIAFILFCICAEYSIAQKATQPYIDSLLKLLPVAREDTNKVNLLKKLAQSYSNPNNSKPAEAFYLQQALQLSKKIKWTKGIIRSNTNLSYYYLNHSDFVKARNCSAEALELNISTDDNQLTHELLDVYAFTISNGDKKDNRGVSLLISAGERFKKLGKTKLLVFDYVRLGTYFASRLNYSAAINYFDKAIKLHEANHYKYSENYDLIEIATFYIQLGNVKKAQGILIKSVSAILKDGNKFISGYQKDGSLFILARAYQLLALCAEKDHDYKKAVAYSNKVIPIAEKLGASRLMCESENALGSEYFHVKEYGQAYVHATRSIAAANGRSSFAAPGLSLLGRIYREAPDSNIIKAGIKPGLRYKKSVELLTGVIKFGREHDDYEIVNTTLRELSLTYEKMHDYTNAYKAYKTYIAQKDSIDGLKNEKAALLKEAQIDYSHKEDLFKYQQNITNEQLKQKKMQSYFFVGGIMALLILSAFIALNYRNQRSANSQITVEKNRSDALLLNILPADVAEELKEKGSANARLFDEVTVLFTDFVNFTTISEFLSPQQLVDELHHCFKAFDGIMTTHNIEKIKTIGDAYLAVAGLPNADVSHAANVVKAAIEIQQFIQNRKATLGNKTFDIRIGIHSGSVVAGIVGVKKFAYDIWGDTVNTAARMEQNSEPGKINVSDKTYELIKDRFKFIYRGEIEAKNKGALKMYFVVS